MAGLDISPDVVAGIRLTGVNSVPGGSRSTRHQFVQQPRPISEQCVCNE